jgi:hypothetical protein
MCRTRHEWNLRRVNRCCRDNSPSTAGPKNRYNLSQFSAIQNLCLKRPKQIVAFEEQSTTFFNRR